MAESKELAIPKISKEQLARTTLQDVRKQGHTYNDLREDGKRFIFFCTLCLAPCYSATILRDHLKGKLHRERLSYAKLTLFARNPWPFSDGFFFFGRSTGKEDKTSISPGERGPGNLKICGMLIKERTLDVGARFIGFGRIAARLFETKGNPVGIDKLWCEWLGEEGPLDEEKAVVPEHDFAIVTFSSFHNLGRLGFLQDQNHFLTSSQAEPGDGEENGRKRKKSFSNPEEISEFLCNQYETYEDVSSVPNSNSSKALVDLYDDHLIDKRVITNRYTRREMRRQQRLFSERVCEVCKHKILPGKDAAAIVNMKTGNFTCSSRNVIGAFHLFHVSCAIHWFLFCECDILENKILSGKGRKQSSSSGNCKELGKGDMNEIKTQIFSVFCPECQGTGIHIEGGVLERQTFQPSQIWRFAMKVSESQKAWFKNPEILLNCSTGFRFPRQAEEPDQEETVSIMKLVRFYRAEMPM